MCGSQDLRIRLSKRYTLFNFLVSTLEIAFVYGSTESKINQNDQNDQNDQNLNMALIIISIPFFIASVLTLFFLFYDHLCCCCCACCLGAEEWRVFDPENHQADLIWRNGEIIDKDKDEGGKVGDDNNMTLKEKNLADINPIQPAPFLKVVTHHATKLAQN